MPVVIDVTLLLVMSMGIQTHVGLWVWVLDIQSVLYVEYCSYFIWFVLARVRVVAAATYSFG